MSMTYQTYDTHPAAELFPMMDEREIKEMAEDIRLNGLREPITRCEGKVLDGRNRLKACDRAGVEPSFVELPPGESPVAFVWSKNYARRHLTISQRSMAAIKMQTMTAKESKERMSRGGTLAVRQGVEIIPQAEKGRTRDKIAEMAHVNPHYISDAMAIQEKAPELASKVAAGEMKIPEAMRALQGEGKETGDHDTQGPDMFDATLLVVDLAVGSEDRTRRSDILRTVIHQSIAAQAFNEPAVIAIREHYREGVVESLMPCRSAAPLDESWTELEAKTRIIQCHAFPLKCRRVKARTTTAMCDFDSRAHALKGRIENEIQRLGTKDETSGS